MSGKSKVSIEIFRGAASVFKRTFSTNKVKTISVGNRFRDTVRLKEWDFEDSVLVVERSANQLLQFVSPIDWGGMFQNGKEIEDFSDRKDSEKRFPLTDRTVMMIQESGWTIAVRGFVEKSKHTQRPTQNLYAAPIYYLFTGTSLEAKYLGVGLLLSIIFLSSTVWTLSRLEHFWNRDSSYSEMFVTRNFSPIFLKNSPDILQKNLDRSSPGESLKKVLGATHDLLAYGTKSKELDQSSIELYGTQSEHAKLRLEEMIAQNSKLIATSQNSKVTHLALPLVLGETRTGSINRTLDKFDMLLAANKELIASRLAMTKDFSRDSSYIGGKPGEATDSSLGDFTEALGAGYRRSLPDAQQQVFEAEQAAFLSAKSRQLTSPKAPVYSMNHDIVGVKLGAFPVALNFEYQSEPVSNRLSALDLSESLIVKIQRKPIQQLGKLNQDLLFKALTYGRQNLQLCFELAAKRHNVKDIQMDWEWRIQPNGLASAIKLLSSSIEDQVLIDCIREKVAQIPFPKPDGGPVVVRYPFEYSPSF
jgi:hypothetical protein